MTPIKLSEQEVRAVWQVLLRELEVMPSAEGLFVEACIAGDTDEITFLGERTLERRRQRPLRPAEIPCQPFSLVEAPLRIVCSAESVSSLDTWAAGDVSASIQIALAELRQTKLRIITTRPAGRPSALALGFQRTALAC